VALYDQFGTSLLLKTFFSKGKGSYHLSRLKESLTNLNAQLPAQAIHIPMTIPAAPPVPSQAKIHSLTDREWELAPERIKDLYVENHQLKSHAELLHHQIRIAPTAAQRLSLALQLLDDRDRNNNNWSAIRKYQATGQLAEEIKKKTAKAINDMSVAELAGILKNYPSYITKDRQRLEGMEAGSKKDKVAERLAERQITLDLAKEKLLSK
jgi:hypothetical protein